MKRKIGSTLYHWVDWCIGIPAELFLFLFNRLPAPNKNSDVRNIVLTKIGTLGDAILMIPALRALRDSFPKAEISVLCSNANIELFKGYPFVDKVYAADFKDLWKPWYLIGLIRKLGACSFDLSIDFEEWSRISSILLFLARVKTRIGFKTAGQHRHYLLTHAVPHSRTVHELECFLGLLKPLGIEAKNKDIALVSSQEHQLKAARLLESIKVRPPFAVLHCEVPLSGRQRQWPLESLAETGKALVKEHNLKLVIVSTAKSRPEAEKLNALLDNKAALVIGQGIFTLYELLRQAKLVITNNTGFMHLAASAGTNVFALHGPTSSAKWGPCGVHSIAIQSGLACSPCLCLGFEYGCKDNRCMQAITPEAVLNRIKQEVFKEG